MDSQVEERNGQEIVQVKKEIPDVVHGSSDQPFQVKQEIPHVLEDESSSQTIQVKQELNDEAESSGIERLIKTELPDILKDNEVLRSAEEEVDAFLGLTGSTESRGDLGNEAGVENHSSADKNNDVCGNNKIETEIDEEKNVLQTRQIGGLTNHGPYSRILVVGDSRLQSLEESWPQYAFVKPQFLIEPHLKLEDLKDFILSRTELPHLENGTLLICSVGLYDVINLIDYSDCASVKNHEPMKILTLAERAVEDLIKIVMMRLSKAYEAMEKALDSSSVICFSAILPCDPIVHFDVSARKHFPKGHTIMGDLLRENLGMLRDKIKHVCSRISKHLDKLSPMPSVWDIMSSYHEDRQIVGRVFVDGINISAMTSHLLACRLNRFLQELFYGVEINTKYIEFNNEQEVIVVGDSRMIELGKVWCGEKPKFYCEPNLGFYNFSKFINEKLVDLKNKIVIVCLGLNDLIQFVDDETCLAEGHEPCRVPLPACEKYSDTRDCMKNILANFRTSFTTFCEKNPVLIFFATIYPIHIKSYVNSQLKTHKEKTGHLIIPSDKNPKDIAKFNELLYRMNKVIRKMSSEQGIPIWDMYHVVCRGYEASTVSPDVLKDGIFPSSRTAEELIRSFFSFVNGKLQQEYVENKKAYKFPFRPLPKLKIVEKHFKEEQPEPFSEKEKEASVVTTVKKDAVDKKESSQFPRTSDSRESKASDDEEKESSHLMKTERFESPARKKPTHEDLNVKERSQHEHDSATSLESKKQLSSPGGSLSTMSVNSGDKRHAFPSPEKHPHREERRCPVASPARQPCSREKPLTPTPEKCAHSDERQDLILSPVRHQHSEEEPFPITSPRKHQRSKENQYPIHSPEKRQRSEERRYPMYSPEKHRHSEERRYPHDAYDRHPYSKGRKYPPPSPERYCSQRYSYPSPESIHRSKMHRSPERLGVRGRSRSPRNMRRLRYSSSPERSYRRRYSRSPEHFRNRRSPASNHQKLELKVNYDRDAFEEFMKTIRKQCQKEKDPVFQGALLNLYDAHIRECKLYLGKPDAHPDYVKEYVLFVDKKRDFILTLGGDPETYDYKADWKKFWPPRMLEIFHKSWEIKKNELLSIMPSKKKRASSRDSTPENEMPSKKKSSSSQDSTPEMKIHSKKQRSSSRDSTPEKILSKKKKSSKYIDTGKILSKKKRYRDLTPDKIVQKKERSSSRDIVSGKKRKKSKRSSSRDSVSEKKSKKSKKKTKSSKQSPEPKRKKNLEPDCNQEPLSPSENTADTNITCDKELPQVLEGSVDILKEQLYRKTSPQNVIKKKTVKVLEVLSLLTYMKERLGLFGILVSKLHDKAVEMEKKGLDPNALMEDEETSTLFSMLSDKISSLIVESDGSAIQKAIMLEAQTLLLDIISEINEIRKKNETKLPVDICQIARLTMGKTILETITTIKNVLLFQGISDIPKKELEQIYMSVKDEQLKLADSAASSERSMSAAASDYLPSQKRLSQESSKPQPEGELMEEFFIGQKSLLDQDISSSKYLKVEASTSKFGSSAVEGIFTGTKSLKPIDSLGNNKNNEALEASYMSQKHSLPSPARDFGYIPQKSLVPPPAPMISKMNSSQFLQDSPIRSVPSQNASKELLESLDLDLIRKYLTSLKNL